MTPVVLASKSVPRAAILAGAGVDLPGRGLMPLVEATVRNIERLGAEGRTGPFVRGDAPTIARDAAALPADWREVFLRLGSLPLPAPEDTR